MVLFRDKNYHAILSVLIQRVYMGILWCLRAQRRLSWLLRGLCSEVRGQTHRHIKLSLSQWILDSCLKNLRNEIHESQRVSFRKGDFIIGASEEE